MPRKLRRVRSLGVTEEAYEEALKAAKHKPEDGATIELGRRLSKLIDKECGEEGETANLIKLSAEFRAVLHSLKMTPISRNANATKEPETPVAQPARSKIEQMRDELAELRAKKATS